MVPWKKVEDVGGYWMQWLPVHASRKVASPDHFAPGVFAFPFLVSPQTTAFGCSTSDQHNNEQRRRKEEAKTYVSSDVH
jgi:hypothetical protein